MTLYLTEFCITCMRNTTGFCLEGDVCVYVCVYKIYVKELQNFLNPLLC